MTAFIPLGVIFGLFFACDAVLWAFGRAHPLTTASLTRGFEPFEGLYANIVKAAPAKGRRTGENEGRTEKTETGDVAVERLMGSRRASCRRWSWRSPAG